MVAKTEMVYQIGREPKPIEDLRAMVKEYLEGTLKAEAVTFLETKSRELFLRWKPEEMEAGKPWQVGG